MALAHTTVAMCVYRHTQRSFVVRNQSGFTLVEVMIVCVIIAIVTMMAVPTFMQWNSRYQLRQATTELAGNLNLARMTAMTRNIAMNVQVALVAGRVQLNFGGVFPPVTLARSVVNFTGGPNVQFTQQGFSGSAANQTLALVSDQGLTYSVVVTPSGKVNWCAKSTCP